MRRRLAALGAAVAALGAVAGGAISLQSGSEHVRLWTSPVTHSHPSPSPRRFAAFSPTGYSITLNWGSIPLTGETGFNTFLNGTQVGSPTSASYTFTNLACGTTYTLGVQAHDGSSGTSQTYNTSYATPNCAGGGGGAFSCPSGVRCFYVAASGSDASNGTSEATPWAHAPGMQTFTGTYTHQAGDQVIFKGGDTWGNANFPLHTQSGSSAHSDYYGADPAWYTGAAFSQPTFSGGNADICPSSCTDPNQSSTTGISDVFIDGSNQDNITIDNIHFTSFAAMSAQPYHLCAQIFLDGSTSQDLNVTINRVKMDGMTIGRWANGFGASSGDNSTCAEVLYAQSHQQGSSIIENSTFIGDGHTYGRALVNVFSTLNNTLFAFPEGGIYLVDGNSTQAGNNEGFCGVDPVTGVAHGPDDGGTPVGSVHSNNMEILGAGSPPHTFYIHDNVIHDTNCESIITYGGGGEIDYLWNNVMYNNYGNAIHVDQRGGGNGTSPQAFFAWNNSFQGGFNDPGSLINEMDGSQSCFISAGAHVGFTDAVIDIENNFCQTNTSNVVDPGITGTSLTTAPNLLATSAQLRTGAYAGDFNLPGTSPVWLPLNGSTPIAGVGTNLTSNCTGALVSLCSDTTYGGTRNALSRPASGSWDEGAFEVP